MKSYVCLECGLSSRYGETHRMDCSSKLLMQGYVRVLEEIRKLHQDLLDELSFACYTESLERKLASDTYTEASESLGLYNEK